MLIFIFLAMNVKYCLTINPVMWFRFMGEDFNILPAWHVDQSVKYSAVTRRIFPLRRESLSIAQYLIKSRSNYKKIKLYDYYFRSERKLH